MRDRSDVLIHKVISLSSRLKLQWAEISYQDATPSGADDKHDVLDDLEDEDVTHDPTTLLCEKVRTPPSLIRPRARIMRKLKIEEDPYADSGAHIQQQKTPSISRGMLWIYLGIFIFWVAVNTWLWSLIDWESSWEVDREPLIHHGVMVRNRLIQPLYFRIANEFYPIS
jgi:hypothetical protein